jgi:hypothetical protein
MEMISDPAGESVTLKATGAGWKYGYLTLTVYEGGIAATTSQDVSVQFGNAVEP